MLPILMYHSDHISCIHLEVAKDIMDQPQLLGTTKKIVFAKKKQLSYVDPLDFRYNS